MKRVERRLTFRRMTRDPWSWRPRFTEGTPRLCLTNLKDPVLYLPEESQEPLVLGQFDRLLRLYQHHGASPMSVQHHGGIAYFESEWATIREMQVEWIEFVNRSDRSAARIDFQTALRYGSWESTPRGDMWVVPLEQYTTIHL